MNMKSKQGLSRELALRIGLAAKVLPGVDARALMEVLVNKVGYPLSDQSLRKITVTEITKALSESENDVSKLAGKADQEVIKEAVRHLWGDGLEMPGLPKLVPYEEGDMADSIRVAIANSTEEKVDGHFGSCPRFLVYQINTDEIRLVGIRPTDGADAAEDKNAYRAAIVDDCDVLYVQSVGGPAAAKVVKAGIYPIKLPEGGDGREALQRLQQTLAGNPPPWLAKIIGIEAEKRTKFGAAESEA